MELKSEFEKLLEHDETWWLIEKRVGETNLFFTGEAWSNSALVAARFKTKDDAQFIIDEIYGPSNNFMMRGSFPVEHMWSNYPPSIAGQIIALLAKEDCGQMVRKGVKVYHSNSIETKEVFVPIQPAAGNTKLIDCEWYYPGCVCSRTCSKIKTCQDHRYPEPEGGK
jgi:hypothetical protein